MSITNIVSITIYILFFIILLILFIQVRNNTIEINKIKNGNGKGPGKGPEKGPDKITDLSFSLPKKENESHKLNNKIENKKKPEKYVYNKPKCIDCINKNNALGEVRDCPTCGSENYDTGCIPAIVQEGKPKNCIPKEFSPQQAFWACKAVSDSQNSCHIVHPKATLDYQRKECGDNYYCAYDETSSCSYNKCEIGKYYSYGEQSICKCEPVPHDTEILEPGIGRECEFKNCTDYQPKRGAPELLDDPGIDYFYRGHPAYMDVPNLDTWTAAALAEAQII